MTLVYRCGNDGVDEFSLLDDLISQRGRFIVVVLVLSILHCLTERLPFVSDSLDDILESNKSILNLLNARVLITR